MRHEGEPSVEEILESIKKVIARDNREALQADRARRASAGVMLDSDLGPQDEDEILELGEAGHVVESEAPAQADDRLTNETAARAMRESLAALAMMSEPGAPPRIVRSGETSLEELVRALLRPMLADWLDRNLPATVDRLVKAEIARIAGKKG